MTLRIHSKMDFVALVILLIGIAIAVVSGSLPAVVPLGALASLEAYRTFKED